MFTCRYQAQSNLFCYQSELMLRMKFSILRSCLCATSCDLELHALLYTFKSGLLDFFPDTALQPSRTPAPDCLQFLQFVGIMRILPNLNSYKKYTRGIISVAGALLERTWNKLPSCNYSLSFLQACNLITLICLISFVSPFLAWTGRRECPGKTLRSYISLNIMRQESHYEPLDCK